MLLSDFMKSRNNKLEKAQKIFIYHNSVKVTSYSLPYTITNGVRKTDLINGVRESVLKIKTNGELSGKFLNGAYDSDMYHRRVSDATPKTYQNITPTVKPFNTNTFVWSHNGMYNTDQSIYFELWDDTNAQDPIQTTVIGANSQIINLTSSNGILTNINSGVGNSPRLMSYTNTGNYNMEVNL